MSRTGKERLDDILDAARRLADIVAKGRDNYDDSWIVRSAVERQLEVIGEAAGRLSEGFALARPSWPIRQARAVRNRIVHDYLDIDRDTLWNTIAVSVPEFASLNSDDLARGGSEHGTGLADT